MDRHYETDRVARGFEPVSLGLSRASTASAGRAHQIPVLILVDGLRAHGGRTTSLAYARQASLRSVGRGVKCVKLFTIPALGHFCAKREHVTE
jgi:hypothetical protein